MNPNPKKLYGKFTPTKQNDFSFAIWLTNNDFVALENNNDSNAVYRCVLNFDGYGWAYVRLFENKPMDADIEVFESCQTYITDTNEFIKLVGQQSELLFLKINCIVPQNEIFATQLFGHIFYVYKKAIAEE